MAVPRSDSRSPGHDSNISSPNSTMAALEAFYKARGEFSDLYVAEDVDNSTAAIIESSDPSSAIDHPAINKTNNTNNIGPDTDQPASSDASPANTSASKRRKTSTLKIGAGRKTSTPSKAKLPAVKKSAPANQESTRITRATARTASTAINPDSLDTTGAANQSASAIDDPLGLYAEESEDEGAKKPARPEDVLSGYSVQGKYHEVKLHSSRKKSLPRDYKFASAPPGALYYANQEHQNVANLPEQEFMDLRPPRLELESAQQDADLRAIGTTEERIKELHKEVIARKHREAYKKGCFERDPTREQMIWMREGAAMRSEFRDALEQVEEFQEIKASSEPPPPRRKSSKLAKSKPVAAQPIRRSKRKASDYAEAPAATLTSGQDTSSDIASTPATKKRKITDSSDFSVATRRSKRKASQLTAETSYEVIETLPGSDASPQEPVNKKRKVVNTTAIDPAISSVQADIQTVPGRRTSARNISKKTTTSALKQTKPAPSLKILAEADAVLDPLVSTGDAASDESAEGQSTSLTHVTTSTPSQPVSSGQQVTATSDAAPTLTDTTAPTQATSKKAAAKKAAKPTIAGGYTGIPSGHGYSTNPPPEAELTAPWQCGERTCASGMTWLTRNRDASTGQAVGRKVISHFFGRNKTSTKLIPDNVWHWLCRKHYQRDKYAHDRVQNNAHPHQATSLWFIDNIEHQLVRLELWRPQATYTVKLMSGAEKRINNWFAELRKHNGDQQAAMAAVPVPAANNTPTAEKDFPILLLEHCHTNFLGSQKTYADLRQMLAWVRNEVNAGNTPVVAPMEFLLDIAGVGEIVRTSTHNYQEWEARLTGSVFDPTAAYTPGEAVKPRRRPAAAFKPFTPVDPSIFEDESKSEDPTGAMIRNAEKMGMVYKPDKAKSAIKDDDDAEES